MILIPIKNLAGAKQRLGAVLDQFSRTELAQAMLLDEAEALASWNERPPVALVTSDPFALEVARNFDFEAIQDRDNRGETNAIEMATQMCKSWGVEFTLVIPGDIPLVEAADLQAVISAAPDEGAVLVPAADERGTNAVLRRPAGLFSLRFGNDSFRPHLAAASSSGKPVVVLHLASIALDVDRPDDLRRLAETNGTRRSQQLARQFDLRELPPAASE